jgi:hypothetical protein
VYSVSETFLEKILSDNRSFAVKITLDPSIELTGTTIQDITLDEIDLLRSYSKEIVVFKNGR